MNRNVLILIYLTVFIGCDREPENNPSRTVLPVQHSNSDDGSMEARQRLLDRINRNGDINDPGTPRPLVTLEEFFENNNDYGSIGYNFYPDQPTPAEFYHYFKTIRDKPEVTDVRVEVKDIEDPEGWPATDTIWVITKSSANDVKEWLGLRFQADDILIGFPAESYYTIENYDVPEGMQAIGIWWD